MAQKRRRPGGRGAYGRGPFAAGGSKWKQRLMIQLLVSIAIVLAVIAIKKMDIAIGNRALETFRTQIASDMSGREIAESAQSVFAQVRGVPASVGRQISGENKRTSFSPPVDEQPDTAVSVQAQNSGSALTGGKKMGMQFHSGQELQVHAVGGGTVMEVNNSKTDGTVIKITHGNEIISVYGGCTKVYVEPLEKVRKGQLIASISPEGDGLYFELWVNGSIVNPADYISF